MRACFFLCIFCVVSVLPESAFGAPARTRIRITSDPPGAAVYVDGAIERAGETPVNLQLTREEHTIRLQLDGHAVEEHTIEVGRNRQTLSFRLSPMGRLEIQAADPSVDGASVSVDGQPVGTAPLTHELEPGRHSVEVSRDGFRTFSQWFELTGGQTYSLTIALQADAPQTGSILIAGEPTGAPVSVDGQARGTSPILVDLPPGEHIVEITPQGLEPYRQVVTVEAGTRVTVNPSMRPAQPTGGTVVVVTEPAGAVVWVDGQERGPSPATIEGLPAGTHVIEARQEGYGVASQTVTVEADRQQSIRLALEPEAATGAVRVTATVPAAEVFLDGRALGRVPIHEQNVSAGEHLVVIRASGHRDVEQRVTVPAAGEAVVHGDMVGVARLSVVSPEPGAEVFVDGTRVGAAPLIDHEVAAGPHTVEVRLPGRPPFSQQVTLAAGATEHLAARFDAGPGPEPGPGPDPDPEDEQPDPEEGEEDEEDEDEEDEDEEDEDRARFSLSPIALRPFKVALDLGWGWPYMVGTYRLSMGVYNNLDVGVEGRSTFWLTEIDAHIRYGFRLARIFGLGAELNIGGGFGKNDRRSFVFGLTLMAGLELGSFMAAFRARLHVYSDDLKGGPASSGQRENGAQFFLGAAMEIRIRRSFHIFAVVDYAPGQDPRQGMCNGEYTADDPCAAGGDGNPGWMPSQVVIEGRAGIGFRFF